jgi:hypothetical protein
MFRGGILGIVILGAVLYFTDAGNWLWSRVKTIDDSCYAGLTQVDAAIANPVCGTLAKGIDGIDKVLTDVSASLASWRQSFMGTTNYNAFEYFTGDMRTQLSKLASPQSTLAQMISAGPQAKVYATSVTQQWQQAVDSFAIGQHYLTETGQPSQGITWLQRGAEQPQGFGLMSQLTLGSLYTQGAQGVPANPQVAQVYLRQAKDSIVLLSANNSPQAKQLLGTLPASPEIVLGQIDRILRDMKKVH